MSAIKVKDFKLDNVSFSGPKDSNNKTKALFVNYNDVKYTDSKILLQTPKMPAVFGISCFKDEKDPNKDQFSLRLKFTDSPECVDFKNKMDKLDEGIKKFVNSNIKKFSPLIKSQSNWVQKPIVKVETKLDKDGKEITYPPGMHIKIQRSFGPDGNPTGEFCHDKSNTPILFFDCDRQPFVCNEENFDKLGLKGANVICLIQLNYISISQMGVSPQWKLIQMKVCDKNKTVNTNVYAIEDSDDENENENENENEVNKVNEVRDTSEENEYEDTV